MVDLRSRRCLHHGCSKQPSFGVEGSNNLQFCSGHKVEGMVNIRLSSGGMTGEGHRRLDSAVGGGGATHLASAGRKRRGNLSPSSTHHAETSSRSSRNANKRARQAPAKVPASSTPVGSAEGESPTPAEDGCFPGLDSAAVKMETGLFEGRPRGSFQSRRSTSSSSRRR